MRKVSDISHANNFNFLRLLFASLVLLAHGPEMRYGDRSHELLTKLFHVPTLSFGSLAVDGFFLLSGFLIVLSWQRNPELFDFMQKRVRRIFPAFVVAFFVCLLVVGPFSGVDWTTYESVIHWRALPLVIAQLQGPDALLTKEVIFPGDPYPNLNVSLWTIAYEFRCYLLVAFLGVIGLAQRKWVWVALFVLALAATFQPAYRLNYLIFPYSHVLLGKPTDLMHFVVFFSAGACFACFRERIPLNAVAAGFCAVALFILLFQPLLAEVALATLGAYLVFWVAFAPIPVLSRFQSMDDVSYGLYLAGWPVQKLLDFYFPATSMWLLVPAAFVVCAAYGFASWHLVERHFLLRRKQPVVLSSR